jgi:hypothetical protein
MAVIEALGGLRYLCATSVDKTNYIICNSQQGDATQK